jgi:hypothetical protein
MFTAHWFHYLCMARETRENGIFQDAQRDTKRYFPHSLVVIVFAALAVEAFINELAEMAGRDVDSSDRGRPTGRPTEVQVLADLAVVLGEIEDARGTIELKYLMLNRVLTGATPDLGSQPYQDFRDLASLRNDLVHPRHRDRTDENGYVSPRSGAVRRLQQRGITYTRGRGPGDPRGGTSWLNELQTPEVADWAYATAANVITAIAKLLPDVRMSGVEMMKERAVDIPAIQR